MPACAHVPVVSRSPANALPLHFHPPPAPQDIFNLLPNLNVAELSRSFTVESNDMMLVRVQQRFVGLDRSGWACALRVGGLPPKQLVSATPVACLLCFIPP